MRRDQIISGINNLIETFSDSRIKTFFDQLRDGPPSTDRLDPTMLISTSAQLMIAESKFGPVERTRISTFEIEDLFKPETWAVGAGKERNLTPALFMAGYRVSTIITHSKAYLALLARDSDSQTPAVLEIHAGEPQTTIETGRTVLMIREAARPDLPVRTMIEILRDFDELYTSICRIYNLQHVELTISSIDSGSEKSLDLVGVASAMSKLSSFFLECWDRVRFNQIQKTEKTIRLASDGLSVITKIQECVASGSMTEAEAEKLKRSTLKNIEGLLNNGAYTEEMETAVPARPTSIPVERRKLITFQTMSDTPSSRKSSYLEKSSQKTPRTPRARKRNPRPAE